MNYLQFILTSLVFPFCVYSQLSLSLPSGFKSETVLENINAATTLTIAPDGRVFIAEQTGAVLVVMDGRKLPEPAIDLLDRLDTWWERGLIGMTLHPDFPQSPFVYLVYVAKAPFTHHVVSRFTVVGNHFDPTSELILLEGDDQSTLGGHVPAGHQGGPICFGADGMIYVGLGEQTAGEPSQKLDTLQGKILRIAPDGSIPEDNPFYKQTTGKYRSIYATGIRNPFGLTTNPKSGRLYETDVGSSAFEEINEIVSGGNYGWPRVEGMAKDDETKAKFIDPIFAYPPTTGRSICGAMFYPEDGNFPDPWQGKLFFVDWASHWIKALDVNSPDQLIPFAEGLQSPVGVATAPDGSVYVLNRNTRWRDGKVFAENAGSLIRIQYVGNEVSEPAALDFSPSQTLAETGLFKNLKSLIPADGFHEYKVNAPVWRPGINVRNWIRIPDGETLEPHDTEMWSFPKGAEIIQHFDTTKGQRHETHVYRCNEDGSFQAAAYRWTDEVKADLIADNEVVSLPGSSDIQCYSPAPQPHLSLEKSIVGFTLQLNSRQLNHNDQLDQWKQLGWLPVSYQFNGANLAALGDTDALLVHRVRTYLDTNCASCHRPGGASRGLFDARFNTPLAKQNLVNGPLMAGDLGIPNARVVAPGSPEQSILLNRMKRHDAFRMPPVAVNDVASPAIPMIEAWILDLGKGSVRLIRDAIDESANNLPVYKIETPSATYYLEKSGAGLSSLVDRDGNDWLGFHPEPGSGAGGEYRGFPNAVHQQAGNYFHAKNQATDLSKTTVLREDPDHVTIMADSGNGKWACRYDFTTTHCTFTMTRMPDGWKYWALYEGIPGGDYNDDDWWMTSSIQQKQTLTQNHEGDIPAPEWIAFGDTDIPRALFLYHHENDEHPDRFYQMHKKMTVFGFGRKGINKFLDNVPQSISIGLAESDDHEVVSKIIQSISLQSQ